MRARSIDRPRARRDVVGVRGHRRRGDVRARLQLERRRRSGGRRFAGQHRDGRRPRHARRWRQRRSGRIAGCWRERRKRRRRWRSRDRRRRSRRRWRRWPARCGRRWRRSRWRRRGRRRQRWLGGSRQRRGRRIPALPGNPGNRVHRAATRGLDHRRLLHGARGWLPHRAVSAGGDQPQERHVRGDAAQRPRHGREPDRSPNATRATAASPSPAAAMVQSRGA